MTSRQVNRAGGLVLIAAIAGFSMSPIPVGGTGPRVVLWAWERPTDLRSIGPRAVVALLAATVTLADDRVVQQPRFQPLKVSPDTLLVPVIRVEIDGRRRPTLSDTQRAAMVDALSATFGLFPDAPRVQVDFDAPVSARTFYATSLAALRARLAPRVQISITALASWCMGDPWIAGLPIDEAVPMLFQMGPDTRAVHAALRHGNDFRVPACRGSVGLSMDEPIPVPFPSRRVYLFNPHGWTSVSAEAALSEFDR